MGDNYDIANDVSEYFKSYLDLYETRDLWIDESVKDPDALVCVIAVNNKEAETGLTVIGVSDNLDKAKKESLDLWKSLFPKLEEYEVADFSQIPLAKVVEILGAR